MGRRYDGLIMKLTEFCFLIALITPNVSAYPYASDAIQFDIHRSLADTDESVRMPGSSNRDRMYSDGSIVFPGDERQVPVCKGTTYCEKVNSYPEDLITKALQRNNSLRYLEGVDVIPDLVQRIDVSDIPLCRSTENVIFPQSAETKDNGWKFVANQDNLKQGVRIETCIIKEDNSCTVVGGLAEGYKTTCKQKYIYRQLLSLTDGSVIPETFRFPSSCCCHVKFVGDPTTRMGVSFGSQKSQVTPAKTRKRK
ncbi:protein spaetzle-like [Ceratina calcarata]|uniref:Protein spaetzle-like n=1 Tax=Ceratina calcarata TaxID=156304 RepID=A0AAJ7NFJ0_9HYME|nr:protein spaetzle-like [Ceratina calcarata]